jgi:hypothetical protein
MSQQLDQILRIPPENAVAKEPASVGLQVAVHILKFLGSIGIATVVVWVYHQRYFEPPNAGLGDISYGMAFLYREILIFIAVAFAARAIIAVLTRESVMGTILWLLVGGGLIATGWP